MDGSRDASFGLRRVEIGIVGDLVVSRVAATMALPKGLLWKRKARRKIEGKGEKRERERDRARRGERGGEKEIETKRDADGKRGGARKKDGQVGRRRFLAKRR